MSVNEKISFPQKHASTHKIINIIT